MPNPHPPPVVPDPRLAECFPPTPWKLVPGYVMKRKMGGAVLLLAGVAAALGYIALSGGGLRQFLDERAVWNDARSVQVPAVVDGEVTTNRLIFHGYHLRVGYPVDAAGTARTESLEFDTLISRIDDTLEPRVRFDPRQPGRFALNQAVMASGGRWGALAFFLLAGVLLVGGSIGFLGWALYAGALRAERVALRGRPVVGTITKIEEQRSHGVPTGLTLYHFRMPSELGGKARSVGFKRKDGTPLWLEERVRLVVCVDPEAPKAFVALRHDLFPMVFAQGTDALVRERLAHLART
jgi:hypothetical protein